VANHRIDHQHFGQARRITDTSFHVLVPVFNEVSNFPCLILKAFRLLPKPHFEERRFPDMCSERGITVVGGGSERENGNRIAVVEPKQDSGFKLLSGRRLLSNNSCSHEITFILSTCQSATPIKKLWNTSKRSPIPSRSKAKIFSHQKSQSVCYAKRSDRPIPSSNSSVFTTTPHRYSQAQTCVPIP
jgi:hypothetical protein